MNKKTATSFIGLVLSTAISVCWAGDNVKSALGGGLGAAAGAAVGQKIGGDKGTIVGGAAGGALGAAATSQGCGRKGAIVGGAIGGGAGAAVGQQTGKNGAVVGAGVGGAAGAAIGNDMTSCRDGKPVAASAQARPQAVATTSVANQPCRPHPKGKAKGWSKNHREC
jgi:hypothetical protein